MSADVPSEESVARKRLFSGIGRLRRTEAVICGADAVGVGAGRFHVTYALPTPAATTEVVTAMITILVRPAVIALAAARARTLDASPAAALAIVGMRAATVGGAEVTA